MKTATLWQMLLLLLAIGRAGAQCPAVTNVGAYNVTNTTAEIGAFYSAAQASSYTFTYQPTAGGTAASFTRAASMVRQELLTSLLPSTPYTVSIVTNCLDGTASAPATTTFTTAPPAPVNDDCAAATALPVSASCTAPLTGTMTSATPTVPTLLPGTTGNNCGSTVAPARDVWYRFVATGTTHILDVTTRMQSNVEVREGACPGPATVLYCTELGNSTTAGGTWHTQLSNLTIGQAYFVRVFPFGGGSAPVGLAGTFTICLTPGPPVPANDACANAEYLFVLGTTCRNERNGTVVGATPSAIPANTGGRPTGPHDVWYRFVATNLTQTLELQALRQSDQFGVEVRSGGCGTLLIHAFGSSTPSDGFRFYAPAVVTAYNCVAGDTYYVRVFAIPTAGLLAPSGAFTLCITGLLPCPPPYLLDAVPTSTTAQLSWQPQPNGSLPPYTYTLEYGLAGFTPGTGTRLIVSGTAQALTGLRSNTRYCYYVRSDCGGSQGSTAFTGPYCFQTLATPPGCTPPTNLAAFNPTTTGAQLMWASSTGSTADFDLEYGPQGFTPGTGTLMSGVFTGQPVNNLLPSTDYCFYVRRSCGDFVGPACFRTAGPATLPDLVVNTTQTQPGGSYNNVTITGTGTLNLTGDLSVAGALVVQAGGTLRTTYLAAIGGQNIPTCVTLIGSGSFELQDQATLGICSGQGISTTGSTGTVQLRGTRTFSPGATYAYEYRPGIQPQLTGPGLPAQVRRLRVGSLSTYTDLYLSQPLAVREMLTLSSGTLQTNGQPLTLLSSATGTALVDNTGGVITGNVTVQRFINSAYQGLGYRHYSAPISNATVGSLSTAGFAPVVNDAYNTAATPGSITPFPTVYGYDEARLATSPAIGGLDFDKGWVSPIGLNAPLAVGRGYTVHLPGTALLSVTGTLNQSIASFSLTRGPSADAGWHLVGNPFPSPLDCSTLTLGNNPTDNLQGVGAAIYVFESTGPYVGQYRTVVAGVGGSPVIASGQGFFVRAVPAFTGPWGNYIQLFQANRKTAFDAADNTFRRGTAETRPLLTLSLRAPGGLADPTSIYFTSAATAAFDPAADALKLPNSTGLNLASQLGSDAYAINGVPLLGSTPLVVPLTVNVPQAGTYELVAEALLNFAPGTTISLHDALLGTRTPLTAATRYAFTLAGTNAPDRFTVEFGAAGALATRASAQAAQVQLFPNPAPSGGAAVTVRLPAVLGTVATATLFNSLGQRVCTAPLLVRAGEATGQLLTAGCAAGVYTVRVQAGGDVMTKRLVLE